MAKNLKISSGSLFADNAIVVSVTPGEFLTNVTFLQMKMKIQAKLVGVDEDFSEVILSSPAVANVPVEIDISSALRSVADKFHYTPTSLTVPYIQYKLSAWEEYFLEGEHHSSAPITMTGTQNALLGGFTDMERLLSDGFKAVQQFSRKPKSGEIVSTDEKLLQPVPFPAPLSSGPISYGQKSKELTMAGKEGLYNIRYSELYNPATDYSKAAIGQDYVVRSVYVVPPAKNRYQFCFVNSLGALETITAQCYPDATQDISSKLSMVSRVESFNRFSRSTSRVLSSVRNMKMSTGFLNEDWLEWWLNEFLTTPMAWIRIEGHFLPCIITMEDSVKLPDTSKNEPLTLSFNVKLSINGGWRNLL